MAYRDPHTLCSRPTQSTRCTYHLHDAFRAQPCLALCSVIFNPEPIPAPLVLGYYSVVVLCNPTMVRHIDERPYLDTEYMLAREALVPPPTRPWPRR